MAQRSNGRCSAQLFLPYLLCWQTLKKKPGCYFAGRETIHLNNHKCAVGAVLFIKGKGGCLIHSPLPSKPPDMVSHYHMAPSRSLGPAKGQRPVPVCWWRPDRKVQPSAGCRASLPSEGRDSLFTQLVALTQHTHAHNVHRMTDIHTHITAMLEIGHGNPNPRSLWPCGWDRSHDSTPEKLSCLPL